MAAAEITPTILSALQGNIELAQLEIDKVTQNDWVELSRPVGFFWIQDETGATEVALYAAGVVNNASNITAAATTIIFDGATVAQWPTTGTDFYVKIGTEIMRVTSYSATVLTVVRGQLGTTATTHANDDPLFVLNSIVLPSAVVGKLYGMVAYLNE